MKMTKAVHVPCGSTVRFPQGTEATVVAKSGWCDGTTHLTLQRGDRIWTRRVLDRLKLEVL